MRYFLWLKGLSSSQVFTVNMPGRPSWKAPSCCSRLEGKTTPMTSMSSMPSKSPFSEHFSLHELHELHAESCLRTQSRQAAEKGRGIRQEMVVTHLDDLDPFLLNSEDVAGLFVISNNPINNNSLFYFFSISFSEHLIVWTEELLIWFCKLHAPINPKKVTYSPGPDSFYAFSVASLRSQQLVSALGALSSSISWISFGVLLWKEMTGGFYRRRGRKVALDGNPGLQNIPRLFVNARFDRNFYGQVHEDMPFKWKAEGADRN